MKISSIFAAFLENMNINGEEFFDVKEFLHFMGKFSKLGKRVGAKKTTGVTSIFQRHNYITEKG